MSTTTAPAPSLAVRLGAVHVTLRADLEFSRHVFAGEPSYVLRDPLTFRCHSFSAADYRILTALDPGQSLQGTFAGLVADGRLDADREEEFYHFILTLHQLAVLSLPVADGGALYARFKRRRSAELRGKLLGFLFLQVPLINPDAFLTRTVRFFDPLFTRVALAGWMCLIAAALGVVISRWHSFWDPIGSLLAAGNLAYLWVSLVVLKVIHEFGHAYACKHFSGRVPEMGAFFIMFTPCAYVDATDCWGFPSRAQDADPAEVQASRQRLAHLRHTATNAEEDAAKLQVRAPAAGELVLAPDARQNGRFFHAGDRVATVVSGGWAVRVLVDAEQFADLHPRVGEPVDVQLVGNSSQHLQGTVESVAEAGSKRINLPALTHLGGGEIAVAPNTLESD